MTNNYDGKIYLVDGQQRLTTLTLLLIKLYHLAQTFNEDFYTKVIGPKIYGADTSGYTYWMGQDGRSTILANLLNGSDSNPHSENLTYLNMINNYDEISRYLDKELSTGHKFKCFVIYLLKRIALVRIGIDDYKDVPMVFEVINDRGEKLKPYEVLKGQLLGQLDKQDVHTVYLPIWSKGIEPIEAIGDAEADNFFKYYFRAKYADTAYHHRQFEGDFYNREIFSKEWPQIGLKQSVDNVKDFVSNVFVYYTNLYKKLLNDTIYNQQYGEYVYYNRLNDQDRQYMLIISACHVNDKQENDKIVEISKLMDRHYVLLQLYGCYDSNSFTEILIDINKEIRNKSLDEIRTVFDTNLVKNIESVKGLGNINLFDYNFFKNANTNLGIRFIRYFFARIENFIATEINPNYKLSKQQLWDLVRNTGYKGGYHVEHILANNDDNRQLFLNDEEYFQRERNRLGALLILKGKDNVSSGNEKYCDKLATYDNADISNRWNRSLSETFYHTNKEFEDFYKRYSLPFSFYKTFDSKSLEERHSLLFEMVKNIWG